jgi:hypothetical protein
MYRRLQACRPRSGCTTALLKRGMLQSVRRPSGRLGEFSLLILNDGRYLGDLVESLKGDVCCLTVMGMFNGRGG